MRSRKTVNVVRANVPGPSVQAWVLPYLIAWVEKQGADASPLRQLPGLTDLSDPDLRLPEASVESAWRLAADLTHDDAIGVHIAESLPRGAFDLVEYALRSSPSLKPGLERLARYGRVVSDRVAVRMETSGDGVLMLIGDTGNTALHPGRAEFGLAVTLKFARESTGSEVAPAEVCFAHPAPETQSEHQRFFRGPLRFDAGANSLILSAVDAARPMLGADEALSAIIRRRLDKVLAERDHQSATLGARVRQLIVEHLGKSPALTSETVAAALGVSRRTMSRRMADEGTSFRGILDAVRRELACALLRDRSLSVSDIAFFLQYSEPAAFNRSFHRWTGQSPRAFRKS